MAADPGEDGDAKKREMMRKKNGGRKKVGSERIQSLELNVLYSEAMDNMWLKFGEI